MPAPYCSPAEIARDPTLSHARKIELLETLRDHHAAPANKGVLRGADLDKLFKRNSLAKDHGKSRPQKKGRSH